jgi:hypothetical protein
MSYGKMCADHGGDELRIWLARFPELIWLIFKSEPQISLTRGGSLVMAESVVQWDDLTVSPLSDDWCATELDLEPAKLPTDDSGILEELWSKYVGQRGVSTSLDQRKQELSHLWGSGVLARHLNYWEKKVNSHREVRRP